MALNLGLNDNPEIMKCSNPQKWRPQFRKYILRELSFEEGLEFEVHQAECEKCCRDVAGALACREIIERKTVFEKIAKWFTDKRMEA